VRYPSGYGSVKAMRLARRVAGASHGRGGSRPLSSLTSDGFQEHFFGEAPGDVDSGPPAKDHELTPSVPFFSLEEEYPRAARNELQLNSPLSPDEANYLHRAQIRRQRDLVSLAQWMIHLDQDLGFDALDADSVAEIILACLELPTGLEHTVAEAARNTDVSELEANAAMGDEWAIQRLKIYESTLDDLRNEAINLKFSMVFSNFGRKATLNFKPRNLRPILGWHMLRKYGEIMQYTAFTGLMNTHASEIAATLLDDLYEFEPVQVCDFVDILLKAGLYGRHTNHLICKALTSEISILGFDNLNKLLRNLNEYRFVIPQFYQAVIKSVIENSQHASPDEFVTAVSLLARGDPYSGTRLLYLIRKANAIVDDNLHELKFNTALEFAQAIKTVNYKSDVALEAMKEAVLSKIKMLFPESSRLAPSTELRDFETEDFYINILSNVVHDVDDPSSLSYAYQLSSDSVKSPDFSLYEESIGSTTWFKRGHFPLVWVGEEAAEESEFDVVTDQKLLEAKQRFAGKKLIVQKGSSYFAIENVDQLDPSYVVSKQKQLDLTSRRDKQISFLEQLPSFLLNMIPFHGHESMIILKHHLLPLYVRNLYALDEETVVDICEFYAKGGLPGNHPLFQGATLSLIRSVHELSNTPFDEKNPLTSERTSLASYDHSEVLRWLEASDPILLEDLNSETHAYIAELAGFLSRAFLTFAEFKDDRFVIFLERLLPGFLRLKNVLAPQVCLRVISGIIHYFSLAERMGVEISPDHLATHVFNALGTRFLEALNDDSSITTEDLLYVLRALITKSDTMSHAQDYVSDAHFVLVEALKKHIVHNEFDRYDKTAGYEISDAIQHLSNAPESFKPSFVSLSRKALKHAEKLEPHNLTKICALLLQFCASQKEDPSVLEFSNIMQELFRVGTERLNEFSWRQIRDFLSVVSFGNKLSMTSPIPRHTVAEIYSALDSSAAAIDQEFRVDILSQALSMGEYMPNLLKSFAESFSSKLFNSVTRKELPDILSIVSELEQDSCSSNSLSSLYLRYLETLSSSDPDSSSCLQLFALTLYSSSPKSLSEVQSSFVKFLEKSKSSLEDASVDFISSILFMNSALQARGYNVSQSQKVITSLQKKISSLSEDVANIDPNPWIQALVHAVESRYSEVKTSYIDAQTGIRLSCAVPKEKLVFRLLSPEDMLNREGRKVQRRRFQVEKSLLESQGWKVVDVPYARFVGAGKSQAKLLAQLVE